MKTAGRTGSVGSILLLLAAGAIFTLSAPGHGPGPSANPTASTAVSAQATGSAGPVVFGIQWIPEKYRRSVTLRHEIVNGVNYQPTATHPPRDLRDFRDMVRLPPRFNDRPAEQVEAQLTITIIRPSGYTGDLWIGCKITIGGKDAPGYRGYRGRNTRTDNVLTYVCRTPLE